MTYSFMDDYSEGCHPEILDALVRTNMAQQAAYGNDEHTATARELIGARCGLPGVPVFLVGGGTLANLIICSATLRSHEAVIAADTGHITSKETGAIEAVGHKIIAMPATHGKISADDVATAVARNSLAPHDAKPRMVYISNATEVGTVYTLAELRLLRAVCDDLNLLLLIDGARMGVALASAHSGGVTLADIAQVADVFWIGGTKVGTLLGEAIVMPNEALAVDFEFHIKQRGALLAKGRTLGIQFATLFAGDLFERASATSNEHAALLSAGIVAAGYELAAATEANQVFAILPDGLIAALQQRFAFYVWEPFDGGRSVVRLTTSWATDPSQIDAFVRSL